MIDEKSQFRDVIIKAILVLICATLYCLGGAEFGWGKWLRRIMMPLVLGGGMFWFSRDWRCLISMPLVGIGTSLGYGADDHFLKVLKRFYCGFVLGAGSSAGDWLNKRFLIAILQTVAVTGSMILLGVYNPLPDARVEEFVIGGLICFFPLMSARKRNIK